jgi:hypothetical protein
MGKKSSLDKKSPDVVKWWGRIFESFVAVGLPKSLLLPNSGKKRGGKGNSRFCFSPI